MLPEINPKYLGNHFPIRLKSGFDLVGGNEVGDIWVLVKVQAVMSSSNNPFVTYIGQMNTPKIL